MRVSPTTRLATAIGIVTGVLASARAVPVTRAADHSNAANDSTAASSPAKQTAAPGLLPEPPEVHEAVPPATTHAPPPQPVLRFPPRIVLLSGADPDSPRAFIVLGDPEPDPTEPKYARHTPEQPSLQAGSQAIDRGPDPLAGTPRIDPAVTGGDAEEILATMLTPRTDSPADWHAPLEPLHFCGEPRALAPCVPPPPCHPALPPRPFDLVGKAGMPTAGPIYGGPCAPRSGTCPDGPLAPLHRVCDRLFDCFYTPR